MKNGLLLLTLLYLLHSCSIEKPVNYTNDNPMQFINSYHKGCAGLMKTTGDSYLAAYNYRKDTLCLSIKFTANCCPEWVDSADVSPGIIKLFVRDTLSGCHCICDYLDDFDFIYSYEGETILEFWQANLDNEFSLEFETTLHSPLDGLANN